MKRLTLRFVNKNTAVLIVKEEVATAFIQRIDAGHTGFHAFEDKSSILPNTPTCDLRYVNMDLIVEFFVQDHK